jgi:hypothetical protein
MEYDDARRSTICPHNKLMSDEDMDRKELAMSLTEKKLQFASDPDRPAVEIQSISWNGMVTLRGWAGEFAPHLFIEAVKK